MSKILVKTEQFLGAKSYLKFLAVKKMWVFAEKSKNILYTK